MKLKRCLAIILSAVLLLTCLPLSVFAAGSEPTVLYVGEKDKAGDNIIKMYKETGRVVVYSVNKDESYYELTYEEGAGYVLTFHRGYKMSDIVSNTSAGECGLYCNGDLTIRIDGSVDFDLNQKFGTQTYSYTYGWYVTGTLTIEGSNVGRDVINISADKKHPDDGNGCVGIYADTLLLHNITVRANGANAGIRAKSAVAMIDASLYCNAAEDMKNAKGEPLFRYGLVTESLIQVGGYVRVCGDVDIKAYDFRNDARHEFDQNIVIYLRVFDFKPNAKTNMNAYAGYWQESFELFNGYKSFPKCIELVSLGRASVLSLDGDTATLSNSGDLSLHLILRCGKGSAELGSYNIVSSVAWWQWIFYFFSFKWINPN